MEAEKKIDITEELITRYITGDASPDEALALSDWLSVGENQKQFDQLEAGWLQSFPESKPLFNKSEAWQNVSGKMITSTYQERKTRRIVNSNSGLYIKIAASILLISIAGLVIYKLNNQPAIRNLTLASSTESKEHTFSDQSVVTLYRNTTITYPEYFTENAREIKLSGGEAFFKISHDAQKPFLIHTPNGIVRVVGTEFDVTAGNSTTEVSVKEGKVILYTETDTVMLTAGLSAIVRSDRAEITSKNVENINVWGYATRKLVFDNTPLKDAIESIEKAYPNTIRLSNKNIENCLVTATFAGESVDKIVNLVADILNLTVTKNGETFTLEGQGCQ